MDVLLRLARDAGRGGLARDPARRGLAAADGQRRRAVARHRGPAHARWATTRAKPATSRRCPRSATGWSRRVAPVEPAPRRCRAAAPQRRPRALARRSAAPWSSRRSVPSRCWSWSARARRRDPARDELTRQLADAEPFSSDVELEIAPRFSPDGTRIAFARRRGTQRSRDRRRATCATARARRSATPARREPVAGVLSRRQAHRLLRAARRRVRDRRARPRTPATTRALVDCRAAPRSRFDLAPDGRRSSSPCATRRSSRRACSRGPRDRRASACSPHRSPTRATTSSRALARRHARRVLPRHRVAARAVDARRWRRDGGAARSPLGLAYGVALGPRGPAHRRGGLDRLRALNCFDLATRRGRARRRARRALPRRRSRAATSSTRTRSTARTCGASIAAPRAAPRAVAVDALPEPAEVLARRQARRLRLQSRRRRGDLRRQRVDGEPERLPRARRLRLHPPALVADGRAIYAVRARRREDRRARAAGGPDRSGHRRRSSRSPHSAIACTTSRAAGRRQLDRRRAGRPRGAPARARTASSARRATAAAAGRRVPRRGPHLAFTQPQLPGLTVVRRSPTLACEPLRAARRATQPRLDAHAPTRCGIAPPDGDGSCRYDLVATPVAGAARSRPPAFGLASACGPTAAAATSRARSRTAGRPHARARPGGNAAPRLAPM